MLDQEILDFTNNTPAPTEGAQIAKFYRSFIPRIFIAASLPLRDVKKTHFERKYNCITLHLNSPNMVPYGKYARLLLSVLTTHAVQSKNNLNPDGTVTVQFPTLQALLDEMKLPKHRSNEIKEQLNRINYVEKLRQFY